MARDRAQALIDQLHSSAITEEARVLKDWVNLRREATGQTQ